MGFARAVVWLFLIVTMQKAACMQYITKVLSKTDASLYKNKKNSTESFIDYIEPIGDRNPFNEPCAHVCWSKRPLRVSCLAAEFLYQYILGNEEVIKFIKRVTCRIDAPEKRVGAIVSHYVSVGGENVLKNSFFYGYPDSLDPLKEKQVLLFNESDRNKILRLACMVSDAEKDEGIGFRDILLYIIDPVSALAAQQEPASLKEVLAKRQDALEKIRNVNGACVFDKYKLQASVPFTLADLIQVAELPLFGLLFGNNGFGLKTPRSYFPIQFHSLDLPVWALLSPYTRINAKTKDSYEVVMGDRLIPMKNRAVSLIKCIKTFYENRMNLLTSSANQRLFPQEISQQIVDYLVPHDGELSDIQSHPIPFLVDVGFKQQLEENKNKLMDSSQSFVIKTYSTVARFSGLINS